MPILYNLSKQSADIVFGVRTIPIICITFVGTMKIEEAILYCLAHQNRGMRTEQIAEMINRHRLHVRKDGQPVTSNQVYAVVCRYPDTFVKAEGRIMLMI